MITKEQLLFELINFSSNNNPLSKIYFIEKYPSKDLTICEYGENLKSLIHDLQCDQIDASINTESFHLIFESNSGYYIAKSREEALEGNHYYLNKIKSLLAITSNYNKMTNIIFPKEDPDQLNLL